MNTQYFRYFQAQYSNQNNLLPLDSAIHKNILLTQIFGILLLVSIVRCINNIRKQLIRNQNNIHLFGFRYSRRQQKNAVDEMELKPNKRRKIRSVIISSIMIVVWHTQQLLQIAHIKIHIPYISSTIRFELSAKSG